MRNKKLQHRSESHFNFSFANAASVLPPERRRPRASPASPIMKPARASTHAVPGICLAAAYLNMMVDSAAGNHEAQR
jgi:hypothetical protein